MKWKKLDVYQALWAQVPVHLWASSHCFQYRPISRFRFKKLQNNIIMKRHLSEWVSWIYYVPHSIHISQHHFYFFVFSHALFWAYVTPVSHIKSAWAGLDVMIFYCSLYYRWYLLLFKVSIICCKIKTL